MKFNLYTPGTRVIYIGDTKSYIPMAKGDGGTIVMVIGYEDDTYELGVDWDEPSEKNTTVAESPGKITVGGY